jgi:hypothetical protein
MDTVAEFRRHATECERMARSIADAEPKSRWRNLAERWHRCADLAEREQREAAAAGHVRNRQMRKWG